MRTSRRFLAALLAATFCLPNPAYALRPELDRSGLKEQLHPSAGMEEGRRILAQPWSEDVSAQWGQTLGQQLERTLGLSKTWDDYRNQELFAGLTYGTHQERLERWLGRDSPGSNQAFFIRNGPLFFVSEQLQQRHQWLEEMEKALGPNLVWVRDLTGSSMHLDPASQNGEAFTHATLAAMRQSRLSGKLVIDAGSRDGFPSLEALRLGGASFVVLIDSDPEALEKARLNLELNRYKEGRDFHLIHGDLRDTETIRRELSRLNRKEKEAAMISNLGDWYPAVNNAMTLALIPVVEQTTGARVTSFIAGGYRSPPDSPRYARENPLEEDRKLLRDSYGFHIDPQPVKFTILPKEFHSISALALIASREPAAGVEERKLAAQDPLVLAVRLLDKLHKKKLQAPLIILSESLARREYLGRSISEKTLAELNHALVQTLDTTTPEPNGPPGLRALWNRKSARFLRKQGVVGILLTPEPLIAAQILHPASTASRLLEDLSRDPNLTGSLDLSYQEFRRRLAPPRPKNKFFNQNPSYLEEMNRFLNQSLRVFPPDREKDLIGYVLWNGKAARTLREQQVNSIGVGRWVHPYDTKATARALLNRLAREVPIDKTLLRFVSGNTMSLPYSFVDKLSPTFPSNTSLNRNKGLRPAINAALLKFFKETSHPAVEVFRNHGIELVQIVKAPVSHRLPDPALSPEGLAKRILEALPTALTENAALRNGSTLTLSYHAAGRRVLGSSTVTDYFSKNRLLSLRTNRAMSKIFETVRSSPVLDPKKDPAGHAAQFLISQGINSVVVREGIWDEAKSAVALASAAGMEENALAFPARSVQELLTLLNEHNPDVVDLFDPEYGDRSIATIKNTGIFGMLPIHLHGVLEEISPLPRPYQSTYDLRIYRLPRKATLQADVAIHWAPVPENAPAAGAEEKAGNSFTLGNLGKLKERVFSEIRESTFADASTLDERISLYEKFVMSQAQRLGVPLLKRHEGILEFNRDVILGFVGNALRMAGILKPAREPLSFLSILSWVLTPFELLSQIETPSIRFKFLPDGNLREIRYSTRPRLHGSSAVPWAAMSLLFWSAKPAILYAIEVIFYNLFTLFPRSKSDGHELNHAYYALIAERIRRELIPTEPFKKFERRLSPNREEDAVSSLPHRGVPGREGLISLIELLFSQLEQQATKDEPPPASPPARIQQQFLSRDIRDLTLLLHEHRPERIDVYELNNERPIAKLTGSASYRSLLFHIHDALKDSHPNLSLYQSLYDLYLYQAPDEAAGHAAVVIHPLELPSEKREKVEVYHNSALSYEEVFDWLRRMPLDFLEIRGPRSTSTHKYAPSYPPPGKDFADLFREHIEKDFGEISPHQTFALHIVANSQDVPGFLHASVVAHDNSAAGMEETLEDLIRKEIQKLSLPEGLKAALAARAEELRGATAGEVKRMIRASVKKRSWDRVIQLILEAVRQAKQVMKTSPKPSIRVSPQAPAAPVSAPSSAQADLVSEIVGAHPFRVRAVAGPDRQPTLTPGPGGGESRPLHLDPSFGVNLLLDRGSSADFNEAMAFLRRLFSGPSVPARLAQASALTMLTDYPPENLGPLLLQKGLSADEVRTVLRVKRDLIDRAGMVSPIQICAAAMQFLEQPTRTRSTAYGVLIDSVNRVLTNSGRNPRILETSAPIQSEEEISDLELWFVKEGQITEIIRARVRLKDGRETAFVLNVAKDTTEATAAVLRAFLGLRENYRFDPTYVMEPFFAGLALDLGIMAGEWAEGFDELHVYPETDSQVYAWKEQTDNRDHPLPAGASQATWRRLIWMQAYYTPHLEEGIWLSRFTLNAGDLLGAPARKEAPEGPWNHLAIWNSNEGPDQLFSPTQLVFSALATYAAGEDLAGNTVRVFLDQPELAVQATAEGIRARFLRLGEQEGMPLKEREENARQWVRGILSAALRDLPIIIQESPKYAFPLWGQVPANEQQKVWEVLRRGEAELKSYLQMPAAGAEETAEAARRIREIFTDHAGRLDPVIAPALKEMRATGRFSEEEVWVRAFLHLLRALEINATPIPAALLSVPVYHAGPFGRGELMGKQEAEYLEEEWIPALRKTLEGVALQLGKAVTPEDLGQTEIERLMTLLFSARGSDGSLLRSDQEAQMYRWSYRELPRLLVPLLAARSVDRKTLSVALENPFRISNSEGNDAVQRAIGGLLGDSSSGFTDDPVELQKNPSLLRRWILLALAFNLVDYSRPSILEEIAREGNLAHYILHRVDTPFLKELGGDRFIGQFLDRLRKPNTLLVHLPDNNAELAASLKLAEVLLSAFPSLRISMIVKADNGVMNDGSMEDAQRILQEERAGVPDIYRRLRAQSQAGRFRLITGAPMHGTPLNLLPQEALAAIEHADLLYAEGEANAWNLNGLAKEIYLGLRLKWPTGVSAIFGLDLPPEIAAQRPPAFFRIDGTEGPYYQKIFSPPGARDRRTITQTLSEQSHAAEEPVLLQRDRISYGETLRLLTEYDRKHHIQELSFYRSSSLGTILSWDGRYPDYPPPGYDFGGFFTGAADRALGGDHAPDWFYSIRIAIKRRAEEDFVYAKVVALEKGSAAGAEERRAMDRSAFLQRYPEQSPALPPNATHVLTLPEGSAVTLYRPETLAAGLEELVARQKQKLPGLRIERRAIPPNREQVHKPSAFIWDALLTLPYDPGVPVLRQWKGQPFAYDLLQMVAVAILQGEEAAGVRVLFAWTYVSEGKRTLAIAVSA